MTNYVMVGLDIGHFLNYVDENYGEDEKYKIIDECNDCDNNYKIIKDEMSEKYCHFGYVISESEPEEGINFLTITPHEIMLLKEKVENEFFDLFKKYPEYEYTGINLYRDIKLHVFTHYS